MGAPDHPPPLFSLRTTCVILPKRRKNWGLVMLSFFTLNVPNLWLSDYLKTCLEYPTSVSQTLSKTNFPRDPRAKPHIKPLDPTHPPPVQTIDIYIH